MYLFKTSGKTFDSVISHQKHAFNSMPRDWFRGEIVLVSKNVADCLPGEKQIQYIMKIDRIRATSQDELERYWPGNKGTWKYIADCYDSCKLDHPFNLKDILGESDKKYSPVMTFCKIEEIDTHKISKLINDRFEPVDIGEIDTFTPISEEDARKRITASIVARRGQVRFRQGLLKAYDNKCAVTGCDAIEALEAAHITPYMGEHTNSIQNGLLLRADIHTLYDLGLIAISSADFKVIIHSSLKDGHYAYLAGRMMSVPNNKEYWPSRVALDMHRHSSGL